MQRHPLRLALLAGTSLAACQFASAGGFDRGAGNIELLFDPAAVATEAGVIYVSPQRELKNVRRAVSLSPLSPRQSDSVDVGGDYAVPRLGAKFNLFEPVDCLATYTQPYGADADYGKGNAYSITATRFEVDSDEFALTCSYKFDAGRGDFRIIGGVSYQEIEASLSRQTLLDFGNEGEGEFNLSDSAWSYRVGAAYEIPDIAFRASVLYSGKYDYDDLSGTVDTTGLAGAPPADLFPNSTGVYDVNASTEIPQAVEVRLQSGIAPDTIAFGSVRWQEWSKLQSIPIFGVRSPVTGGNPAFPDSEVSFDPFYEDGWTVTAGVGRKFSDKFSALASLTWDKGTSTDQGVQSDTYSLAVGGSYAFNNNVEFRLGGSIGVLTGGRSDFRVGEGDDANAVSYEYDADVVSAGSASIKVKF